MSVNKQNDNIPYVAPYNPNYKYHLDIRYDKCVQCGGIFLHQIGDLAMNTGVDIEEHLNTVYEFTYVLEGRGTVVTGNTEYNVSSGDCVLSLPGEMHYIRSDDDEPLRYAFTAFLFSFDDMRYKELKENLDEIRTAKSTRLAKVPTMRDLFYQMLIECQDNQKYKWNLVGSLLDNMIIRYLRAHNGIEESIYWNLTYKKALAYRIKLYLDTHFLELIQLSELEEIFHYKYQSIESVFSAAFGITLTSYATKLKMEEAAHLIASGVSITKISELLHYSSIHSFTRSFRNYYGDSPTKFLKTKKSEMQ